MCTDQLWASWSSFLLDKSPVLFVVAATLHSSSLETSRNMFKRYEPLSESCCSLLVAAKPLTSMYSGLARSLRATSTLRQPAVRRAFLPIKKNLAPSIAARYASTGSADIGKIHQVIGAVVDGMEKSCSLQLVVFLSTRTARPWHCAVNL